MEKTIISQLPLWRKHVYLWTVYIQFCCPKFSMTQMKESVFYVVHGSQHFLSDTCPIALFGLLFSPGIMFQMLLQSLFAAYVCLAVVFLCISHLQLRTHSSFQISGISIRPTCAQIQGYPCVVSML